MTCEIGNCQLDPVLQFIGIEGRNVIFQANICEQHGHEVFNNFLSNRSRQRHASRNPVGTVEVDCDLIVYHRSREEACVYLHELKGSRYFCMIIDSWAWWALIAHLKREATPCSLTHTAWAQTVVELNGELQDVILDRHEGDEWWSAMVRIKTQGRELVMDVRPIDAYILALINAVPVLVNENAFEKFSTQAKM